jgi:hypothetical protein
MEAPGLGGTRGDECGLDLGEHSRKRDGKGSSGRSRYGKFFISVPVIGFARPLPANGTGAGS